ncbi:MAG: S-methyl-5-thioribose-1-phosphate isomerase [Candidatus Krumholzibacteriota bacterium]|nr:S-methyl-5-thioribose-1-phosphate isomerase [Candidatus Krumholzibacteriota bacterium]
MKVKGKDFRSIWVDENDDRIIKIIDQRHLPHEFVIEELTSVREAARAIRDMHVRGAGLIGVTAAYGMYLAALSAPADDFDAALAAAGDILIETRPTAINLSWAVQKQLETVRGVSSPPDKIALTLETAGKIARQDAAFSQSIGTHGLKIIEKISEAKNGETVNILTHCNAGWLAFVDYGTATAPIYAAFSRGIKLHVWVDETRPWNQGSRLTAWELGEQGVPYSVIPDNLGGHLMQHGMVDLVIVGADRTTITGDVANKTGTYLKALAAHDNHIPFYAAFPSTTFDWNREDGIGEIPIEERSADEVKYTRGWYRGEIIEVLVTPANARAVNYSFDVTPARLITGLITERGVCRADRESILDLFPERKP